MTDDPNILARRRVLMALAAGGAVALSVHRLAGQPVWAGSLPLLKPSDPAAAQLGYVEIAANVDTAKYPQYEAGQICSNCRYFQGKADAMSAPCVIFPGKAVAAAAWCAAYAAR